MAEIMVEFELVSPDRLLVAEPVEMVVVPGEEGDFGVLPGHAPLISTVRPGVIHIFSRGQVARRIFVAGGFAEVVPGRCTVLAEEAMPVDELDRGSVEQDLKDAGEDVGSAHDLDEREDALARAAIARAKLAALDHPTYQ